MSRWGGAWGERWGGRWGAVEEAVADAVVSRGGGLPEGGSRKEPARIRKARKASEERRYKKLKALDDTVEAVWTRLNPVDQVEVPEVVIPEEIKPADVRVSDLIVRPTIDFDRAIEDTRLYRQAIAALEEAIALYEARLIAEEDDIEALLLATM